MKDAPRTRKTWWRQIRHALWFQWHRVRSLDDHPRRIAFGIALGFFIGWLPIVGVQMLACVLLAYVLRCSFVATLPGVWMSNPLTMIPMYWAENRVGAWFIGEPVTMEKMTWIWDQVGNLISEHGFWLGTWEGTLFLFRDAVWPFTSAMFIGGTLIGVVNALIVYPLACDAVHRYQAHRRLRLARWLRAHEPIARVDVDQRDPTPSGDHKVAG